MHIFMVHGVDPLVEEAVNRPLDVAKPLQIRSEPAKTTRFPLLGELHTTIQAWKIFAF
jgi:hypothetical protein